MSALAVSSSPLSQLRDAGVAHGSLVVAPALDAAFTSAAAYLSRDAGMRDVIDRVEADPRTIWLQPIADGNDRYDPSSRTVYWDPHSALRTTAGGTQSPALGLGHELGHASAGPGVAARGALQWDARYDNREERRVVVGLETHAARTLGEGVRHDHAGTPYDVADAISR